METEVKRKIELTSEFIVSTCQLLPKSCGVVSELKYDPIIPLARWSDFHITACGSDQEFYIEPLNTCISDHDMMWIYSNVLAFVDEIPVVPNNVHWLYETIKCCKMIPCLNYPGFLRLRFLGMMNYNWKFKKYEFDVVATPNFYFKPNRPTDEHKNPLALYNPYPYVTSSTVTGPAILWQTNQFPKTFDTVKSVWCPQWPREAKDWPKRHRSHGWPTNAKISEVVQNGCHVVDVQHRACRNDKLQWRLSFSVAEVILLQSWNQVQQIVYHLLRFFCKREIIQKDCPKEDEVLCTYHIKTLMLWTCETMSSDWWNSVSVIETCSDLLGKLLEWLKRGYIANYFIPEANLFHEPSSFAIFGKMKSRLNEFHNSGILCDWFGENYIKPFTLANIKDTQIVHAKDVTPHLKDCKQAVFELRNAWKFKGLDNMFFDGFPICNTFNQMVRNYVRLQRRFRSGASMERMFSFIILTRRQLMPESIECFTYYDSTLHSLNAAYGLECQIISWDSEVFHEFIRGICLKPKIVRCQYHTFPTPCTLETSLFQYLRAQELMENLTGSNSHSAFQLMSLVAKSLLGTALGKNDSQNTMIAPAALLYLAALHFASSENQLVMDRCSAFFFCETSNVENETLNAGCLFFIDDVVRIVGFCLLYKKFSQKLNFGKRPIYLDLRLTPKVFAYYLTAISTSIFSMRLAPQLNHDMSTSAVTTLDHVLLALTKRTIYISVKSRICFNYISVYRREESLTRDETCGLNPSIVQEKLIDYLTEYAVENMTTFYNAIRKDFGVQCNTADCYRALYLYKSRRYDEVLLLCEEILNEPDLQSDFNDFAFANVLLLPPLDSLFDRDVQSLLGFHTLFYYLSPLNEDAIMCDNELTNESTFVHLLVRSIYYRKGPLSESNFCTYAIRWHYFLRRHFLARYLKLRCCIDFNRPRRKALVEFAAVKCNLRFECIIRWFLLQNYGKFRNN